MRRSMFGIILIGVLLVLDPVALRAQGPATPPADPARAAAERGRKLNQEGKRDEAIAAFQEALRLDPNLFQAHIGLGSALDLKGDYAAARSHFAKAIEITPADTRQVALTAMGVSYAFESKAADAAKYYEQALDMERKASNPLEAAAVANALGRIYLESGDLSYARTLYREGYDLAKQAKDLPPDEVDLWTMRWLHAQARIEAREGEFAAAHEKMAELKRLIDKEGKNAEQEPIYHYLAGYVLLFEGKPADALAELEKADQKDVFIQSLIAQAYAKKGDLAAARTWFEKVLASTAHSINNAFARPVALRWRQEHQSRSQR